MTGIHRSIAYGGSNEALYFYGADGINQPLTKLLYPELGQLGARVLACELAR
jgi:hypothetical protein